MISNKKYQKISKYKLVNDKKVNIFITTKEFLKILNVRWLLVCFV